MQEVEVEETYNTPNTVTMQSSHQSLHFPVDLRESSDAYQCAMDMPGMAKADIKVVPTL